MPRGSNPTASNRRGRSGTAGYRISSSFFQRVHACVFACCRPIHLRVHTAVFRRHHPAGKRRVKYQKQTSAEDLVCLRSAPTPPTPAHTRVSPTPPSHHTQHRRQAKGHATAGPEEQGGITVRYQLVTTSISVTAAAVDTSSGGLAAACRQQHDHDFSPHTAVFLHVVS